MPPTLQRQYIQVCLRINRGIFLGKISTGCATVTPGKEKSGEENPDPLVAESSTAGSNPDQISL